MNLEEIKKKVPEDFEKHTTKDLGIFTSSIFGESYVKTFKELFDISFSIVVWITRNKNFTTFYRSQKEHDNFRQIIGKKCRDKEFAFLISKKLKELTDWINKFINENNNLDLFLNNKKKFIDNYRLFFAYHQAVYFASDFISKNNPELKEILQRLNENYTYNEMIVPNVENYLVGLGVGHLHYKEDKGEIKDRIMFFYNDKEEIDFFGNELNELEDFIKNKKEIRADIKELKGVGIQKGKVKGKVKVITDPNKQRDIKDGMILVTSMTRPQFNHLLSKCKAIITNNGGILCHASILARESKIPCVVGTKIATDILKDNDIVELDGEKGIIRKINS